MEILLQDNPTQFSTDIDEELIAKLKARKDGEELSISEIASITGIDEKFIRKYLYTGIIGSRKKEDVLAWIEYKSSNVLTRLPRVSHQRVFNKWR